ncbi:MAG: hypothetical protein ABI687_03270 [Flavitalea sp.]
MRILIPVIILFQLSACVRDGAELSNGATGDILAYVPIYAQPGTTTVISIENSRSTKKAGKIYAYRNYIFQNELNEGIHIIDNSNPSQPHKIAFLKIPYNSEMAVTGYYMYANSINSLVVIDIHDPLSPSISKIIKDAFPLINQKYPPAQGTFVCADPSKGIVVDWELKTVETAACRR